MKATKKSPKRAPAASSTRAAVEVDRIGRDVLDARIATLEPSVKRQPNVTEAELAAHRPGGTLNPDTSAMGALAYLLQLSRWHATGPQQPNATAALRWDDTAMADMRAALAAEPIVVTMQNGDRVAVHPKSEFALQRMLVVDRALTWVVTQRLAVEIANTENPTPTSLDTLYFAIAAQARLEREFIEIVCCPGPGLPWPETSEWDPPLADWSAKASPLDLAAIRKAHLDVNIQRLLAISERTKMFASGASESTPLAVFMGVMSADLKVQPSELTKRWSLGEVFAQALVKWEASERAKHKEDATPKKSV